MRINLGKVVNNEYIKEIDFDRAVLWKTRQISLNVKVVEDWFIKKNVLRVVFVDNKTRTKYIGNVNDLKKSWKKVKMHQEVQYYFSIDLLKKIVTVSDEIKVVSNNEQASFF